jgi:hypothetical protein
MGLSSGVIVVSKLECLVLLASEVSGFVFLIKTSYQLVVTVGMGESQAAFWRDFPTFPQSLS